MAAAPDALARAEAEHRQLTVMFCDLVGSTPLSARLDPEDLRGIIGTYHRCVAKTVEGFGGFVARHMGDGVLIYFGYPQAHENDAERATRCGLGSVVDQHGSGAERRANLAERGAQRRDVGEVAGYEERTRRALAERIGECGAGFALQVEKRDLGTVLDKGADKGRANATGAAGDDHRSAFE